MKFTVEAIEDNIARLESDSEKPFFVDFSLLPEGVKEGDILDFDGKNYIRNAAATSERRKAVYEKFDKLFRKE